MDPLALNYNATATVDDGSCVAQTFGCLGYGQTFNGAVGTTSSNTLLLDINGNVAANNYGCEAGSNSVQHCNVSPAMPSLINGVLITTPGVYAGVANSTVAATTPIVTAGDGITCNFDMPTVLAQGITASGIQEHAEIRIDLGRTPIDDSSNSSNNLRFVTAVQFVNDSDLPVGATNLGTINVPHTTVIDPTNVSGLAAALNAEVEADNDVNTLSTSISPMNQYVHSTFATQQQMQTAAQQNNATKVRIYTFTKNYLIDRTFGSVQTYNMVLGCTNQFAVNYNVNATVDDGSCQTLVTTGSNQNVGCSDPTAFNYFPNSILSTTSNNNYATCSTCQAPSNPIRAITANAAGQHLAGSQLSPDFNIDWSFREMVSADHNVLGGVRQYNMVTNQQVDMVKYNLSANNQGYNALTMQNYAYQTTTPTGYKHFNAAHLIQFRVNSQGTGFGQWRNFQQNLAQNWAHVNFTKVQFNHTFNGPIPISGFGQTYTSLNFSGSNKVADNEPNQMGTTGMSSTIFPGTLNVNGTQPPGIYNIWQQYPGFYPGDVWEFRVASVCYNPDSGAGTISNSAWSQTYTFTQPTCQELYGIPLNGAVTGC